MLIGIFYSQIVESSSLVSVLFWEAISHSYISFFHLLVNGFSVIIIMFAAMSSSDVFDSETEHLVFILKLKI